MIRHRVLKIKGQFILLGQDNGSVRRVHQSRFDTLPKVGDIVIANGERYHVEKASFMDIINTVRSYFINLPIEKQALYVLIAVAAIGFKFLLSSDLLTKKVDTVGATPSNSMSSISYSETSFSSSERSYSSSSSSSSSSTEASSSKEIWAPTSQADVNKYLNIPQTKIILRGKILQKIDYELEGSSNIYEIEAEAMGIFEPDTYREYSIPGDRLLIRTTHNLSPYINQVMVYTGNTISQQTYGTIGKGALTILEFRKTAQAQEAERASIEASKAQSEAAQRVQVEQTPVAPSSATATSVTPAPAPQTGLRPFNNCTEARRAGRTNIPASDPQYGPWLDRDKDGFGCDD